MPKVARKKNHICTELKKDGSVCGKVFPYPIKLVYHIRTHTGEKPEICHKLNDNGDQCKMKYAHPGDLQKHIQYVHNKEKTYVCKHILEDGLRKGEQCGRFFFNNQGLVYHICTHTGEKPCICQELNDDGKQCKMRSANPANLRSHIQSVHNKEKGHVCKHIFANGPREGEECGMSFTKKEGLVAHIQHHTGLYLHVCKFFDDEGISCGKGFPKPDNLRSHVMTNHTDKTSPEYLKYREKYNKYWRERYANDVEYRVSNIMRSSFTNFMNNHGGKTDITGRTQDLLGCTWEQLVIHLHNNPHGYTLDMEGIDIDHIRCVASFLIGCVIEQHRCFNFNNLQLMPAHENRNVKRATYIPAEYEKTDSYKAIELLVPGWVEMYTA